MLYSDFTKIKVFNATITKLVQTITIFVMIWVNVLTFIMIWPHKLENCIINDLHSIITLQLLKLESKLAEGMVI